jgi:hypothetical protein
MDRVLAATMGRPGPLTRAELTRATGLSVLTVGIFVAELVRLGLFCEMGRGFFMGGRRLRALQFNADFGVVAGVVLESRTMRFVFADLIGRMLAAV